MSNDKEQKPGLWLNMVTIKTSGKQFYRSQPVTIQGVEVQVRAHLIKKADGTSSIVMHFDEPYSGATRSITLKQGAGE